MIPDVWERKSLVSLTLHLGRGKSPNYFESDTTIFAINQKCIRNGTVNPTMARGHNPDIPIKSEVLLEDGDICVNSTGNGTIGRVGLWKTPVNNKYRYFADTHVTVVRPARDLVYPKFLAETLQSYDIQNSMEMECFTGSTNQVELNKSAFSALQILFPPINVQKKIAAILSSVDDAIQATQAVIDQTRTVKQGLLQQLLTRGIGHTRFKQTEIGKIPEEWETGFLKEFCEQICVGFVGTCEKYYCTNGIPMIRTGNLKEGFLDLSKMKYVTNDFHRKQKKSQIKPEDLLIARHGNHGQTCLVPKSLSEANCLNVVIVRANKDYFNPLFLQYLFNSKSIRQNIESRSAGSTQKVINTSEIARTIFPKPSLHEQKEIAEIIQSIDYSINLEDDKLQSLYSIKRGLMQDLLTGRVRVKLDEMNTT